MDKSNKDLISAYNFGDQFGQDNRDLRFRIWTGSKMIDPYCEDDMYCINTEGVVYRVPVDGSVICKTEDHWIPMLWTGLKTKDRKFIFEMDIVEAWSQGVKGTFVVKWRQEGAPMYILFPAYQGGKSFFWNLHGSNLNEEKEVIDDLKILGNYYENPELIKLVPLRHTTKGDAQ